MRKKSFFAFVLMPFADHFNDIYQIGIKEAAKRCDVRAERLDEQLFGEGMMDRICRQIDVADFVIADLSERNPNVFYELGYAHAKGKLCVLLTQDASDIPFDLKHRRHVVYGTSITYLRDELVKNIEWAKGETQNISEARIRVALKPPMGDLTKTEHSAKASIQFRLDLFNETSSPSPEISAIYFYTGTNWSLKQDDKQCPHTDADLAPFKFRYFLAPPVRRLEPGAWAQVTFEASRYIAYAWRGDEIKDSYSVGGRSVFRIVTTAGNFDYEESFNIEVSDVPF